MPKGRSKAGATSRKPTASRSSASAKPACSKCTKKVTKRKPAY